MSMMIKEDDGGAGKRRPIRIGNKSAGVLKTSYELLWCNHRNRKGGFTLIFVSFRSTVRRSGFWGLHPRSWRIRPIWST